MISGNPLRVADYDYDLPHELIAQHPLPHRDDSRMMVVDRKAGTIRHGRFREFAESMSAGDVLVLNDTRVMPARLWGTSGEAKIEFLFIREVSPGLWEVLCRPSKRVREGGAAPVQHIGKLLVLWRPIPEKEKAPAMPPGGGGMDY